MAPSLSAETHHVVPVLETVKTESKTRLREPLKPNGVLDTFDSFEVTPVIGREFPNASLKEWLHAPNSDELLKDLAITGKQLSTG